MQKVMMVTLSAVGSRSCIAMQKCSTGLHMRLSCLHLTGKAEFLYDVLSAEVKVNLDSAVDALCERLQPIQHAALASAQLIRRKQGAEESVDAYAQGFEQLFAKSYGNRTGMDSTSKCLLKRDLFTQGLLHKWQEKISSSADTDKNDTTH